MAMVVVRVIARQVMHSRLKLLALSPILIQISGQRG
jgi:hypothetical protein